MYKVYNVEIVKERKYNNKNKIHSIKPKEGKREDEKEQVTSGINGKENSKVLTMNTNISLIININVIIFH